MRLFPPSLTGFTSARWAPPYLIRVLVFIAALHQTRWQPIVAQVFSSDNRLKAARLGWALLGSMAAIMVAWLSLWSLILYTALEQQHKHPPESWRVELYTYIPWVRFLIGLLAGVVIAALVEALTYTKNWWRIPMAISGLFWALMSWQFVWVAWGFAKMGQAVLWLVLSLASLFVL